MSKGSKGKKNRQNKLHGYLEKNSLAASQHNNHKQSVGAGSVDARFSWPPSEEPDDASISLESCSSDNDDSYPLDPGIIPFLTQQLVFSRAFLLIFQFVINKIMKDYPTDAFRGLWQENDTASRWDYHIQNLFGGLARWDSRQFLHVAEFGYTWEQNLAFFPLFPKVLRILGTALQYLLGPVSLYSAMILAGVVLNNALFIVNGRLLFQLVLKLTGSLKEALIAAYIFCWNPASVFFSSVYSESLYMLLVLSALLFLQQNASNTAQQIVTAFIVSFAFLTRSNGLLNLGYILWPLFLEVILHKCNTSGKLELETSFWTIVQKSAAKAPVGLLCLIIVTLPLYISSSAVIEKFCTTTAAYTDERLIQFAANKSFVLPGNAENLSWCSESSFPVPPYYSHVQEKYWDVGWFAYWQWRKIPLFLLAAPTLGFVFYGLRTCSSIFLRTPDGMKPADVIVDRRMLIPYAFHSVFIALAGIFCFNVEVTTRILFSSGPYIYIVIARIMSRQTPRIVVPDDLLEPFVLPYLSIYARVRPLHFLMLSYLLGYFFLGTTLHVNWLPYV
ncbi:GPI mannosyltransferase [Aphelenchoides avenae]|nr:GPI mannosyltransferase [Aphelenchus avenae]